MLIEVSKSGFIRIRETKEDGTYYRRCIAPGKDVSGESQEVQNIAAQYHTPEAIAAYQAALQVGI